MPFSWCADTIAVKRAQLATTGTRRERDWENATTHYVGGCSVQPSTPSTDWMDVGQVRDIPLVVIAPSGSDIAEGDRIVWDGKTYEIDGAPETWRSPTGAVSNVRVRLRSWGG